MTERDRQVEPPKTEDQLEYEGLPNAVLRYLDITKSTHNENIGEDSRAALRARAAEQYQQFKPEEEQALIGYLTWRQENVIAPQIKQATEYEVWRAKFDKPVGTLRPDGEAT